MNLEDLINELEALIDKYKDDEEPTEEDAERMAELTRSINETRAAQAAANKTRTAAVAAARAAIENGTARRVDSVPLARSANVVGTGNAYDVTDYKAAERRAWVKGIAERSGVQLVEGYALTDVERAARNRAMEQRAAYNHMTSNTDAVIPVELQNEIISLIDNTAVLWGDMPKQSFPHQFEIIRHKSIDKGDAAKANEGAAPSDDEQNAFDTLKFEGVEIKKTVKMSRRMAVQSVSAFESYIVSEIAARLSVACNAHAHARLADASYGMDTGNKIQTAKAQTLAKADLAGLLSKLYTYGNAAPKGAVIYANNNVIWNYIAMLEDANGRSYFVDEKNADPSVEGHIFGKLVKRDDSIADGVIIAGYPDLFKGNVFDGPDVMPYIAPDGTQNRCFDGYELIDCGLAVPKAFAQLTIKTA
jgi:HK97 family phage major capsid protein